MLSYKLHGTSGPLVLMLHGLGSRGEDWIFQIEALRGRYRVVTPDLIGHGDSPDAIGMPTMGDFAQDVTDLLQHIGAPSAHLVGLSLGGGVALQIGVDHPGLVDSLTIVNAAATLRVPRNRYGHALVRMALLLTDRRKKLGEWVAAGLFPRDEQHELRDAAAERIAENLRRNYLKAIVTILRFDLRKQLHQIESPTLVVAGRLDNTVPLARKTSLAQSIPDARLEIIEGSGHATPLDSPDEFNRLLLEFLAEREEMLQRALTEPS